MDSLAIKVKDASDMGSSRGTGSGFVQPVSNITIRHMHPNSMERCFIRLLLLFAPP